MDGPGQLKPLRILVTLTFVASLVGPLADVRADRGEKTTQARAAAAQSCARIAETARDLHRPWLARPLADAGLNLLRAARATDDRDPRPLRLEARLRLVRGQSQAVFGPFVTADAEARDSARRDFLTALDLARPLLASDPADRGLRRLIAAAELGLAQDETNAQAILARCRSAVSLLENSPEADRGGSENLWLLASAYQLLGEAQSHALSDPQAALETFSAALPLWQRIERLHPLGTTKLARCHLAVAGAHGMLEQRSKAREHVDTALELTRARALYVETLLVRARALTLLAALPAEAAPHNDDDAEPLDEAAALYRRLPLSVRPVVEEAVVWRCRAERYLQNDDVAQAQALLERAVEQLESAPRNGPQQAARRRDVELALCYLALGQLSEPHQPDEAHQRFAAACELFAARESPPSLPLFDPTALDARRVALICQTRLAEHLLRSGDPEAAAAQLKHATGMFVATADAGETQRAGDRSAAPFNPVTGVPRMLLLPLARSLHLLAKVQSQLDPQQATSRFDEAVACYEAALCQGAGDPVDLAVCHLDHAAVLVHHQNVGAARDRLAVAAALLRDAAEQDPRGWLPLSTAYAQLAEMSVEGPPPHPPLGKGGMGGVAGYLDRAIDAAREAVSQNQPAARRQLANLLLERGLAVLDRPAGHAPAQRDLEQAAREYRLLRSEAAETTSDDDPELLWAELLARRTLAKLEWIEGEALESVCRRWQEARHSLERVREESGPWYAEAARLEGLRAELIAWSCAGEGPRSLATLVPTIDALPAPMPAVVHATVGEDAQDVPVRPTRAAAAQAYEIANRHYEAAERLGVAVADEWDVLLFNAADYCENFLGDARQALGYFEQELALQDRLSGSPALRAGNRALLCARRGLIESRLLARPDRAAELYRQAAAHLTPISSDDLVSAPEREIAIQAELSLGLLGAQLPEFQQAAQDHFAAALRMLAHIQEPSERALSFEYWAHHGLARQLRRVGDEALAQQHVERAAALAAQLGFTEPDVGTAERRAVE